MAATIITIAIEKGGAGKTTTASNFAYLMGDENKRVLCIDTDPQGNLTYALSGGDKITDEVYDGRALYDMIDGFRFNTRAKDFIVPTNYENVDMIPASSQTPRIDKRIPDLIEDTRHLPDGDPKKLKNEAGFLRYFLDQVIDEYDYIIIDTQPTRGSLILTNAIAAADYLLIPTTCDAYSEEAAARTYTICTKWQDNADIPLRGIGVMLTMVDKGAASREMREECQKAFGDTLFETEIPNALSAKMSSRKCLPVTYMAKTQPVGKAYLAAYEELKKRISELEVK